MRNIVAKFIDSTVLSVAVFILVFAWVRFYTRNMTISIIIGAILAIVICIGINLVLNKKEAKILHSKKQKKDAETLALGLLGLTNLEILEFFAKQISKRPAKVTQSTNCLKIEYYSAQKDLHSTKSTAIVVPLFHTMKVETSDVIFALKLARAHNVDEMEIYGISFSPEAKSLLSSIKNIQTKTFDQYQLFSSLSPEEIPTTLDTSVKRLNWKEFVQFALDKKRARNYLLFGLIILATSFMVPYKIYYLVMGSILCITALTVRLIPLLKKT